jgi:hypothetical protein
MGYQRHWQLEAGVKGQAESMGVMNILKPVKVALNMKDKVDRESWWASVVD